MTHRLDIRVYYEDTDLGGVVYYANYLKFLERGRTEYLRDAGLDQSALKGEGLVFVVRRIAVEYRAPARFDDLVTVTTEIAEMRGASVLMRQAVERDGTVLTTADVTVACMSLEGRPARLPDAVRRALE